MVLSALPPPPPTPTTLIDGLVARGLLELEQIPVVVGTAEQVARVSGLLVARGSVGFDGPDIPRVRFAMISPPCAILTFARMVQKTAFL